VANVLAAVYRGGEEAASLRPGWVPTWHVRQVTIRVGREKTLLLALRVDLRAARADAQGNSFVPADKAAWDCRLNKAVRRRLEESPRFPVTQNSG
jgi:hypothetical protein